MIKVVLLDDQYIVLNGVQQMLAGNQEIELSGVFQNPDALEEGLKTTQPDVLLLDIRMPGEDGDTIASRLSKTHPAIKILALTNFDTTQYVRKMMRSGVQGYLLKNTDRETLIEAIKAVHDGEQYIESSLREQLLKETLQQNNKSRGLPSLTKREKEILTLIVKSHASSKEIADKLFLSLRTVESHRYHLFQKLDVKNVSGLVAKAIELGLV